MNIEQDILAAKVLIVDDQLVNVKLLTRMLEEAGYRHVTSTLDPLKVCGMHRSNAYDLILLDLQMPGMDGFAVMEGLKTNPSESYLPVIVLTAQPGHKLRALNAGARDFISKPFDLLEVKTRIRNMLEVRVLYRRLQGHNEALEAAVRERTAELRESEARYRSLTELAADWYWEQDETGAFTKVSGPVIEMLGIRVDALEGDSAPMSLNGQSADFDTEVGTEDDAEVCADGWNRTERQTLRACIRDRQPFLDFALHRTQGDGSTQHYRVSGQPMFDQTSRFLGYRGVGVAMAAPT